MLLVVHFESGILGAREDVYRSQGSGKKFTTGSSVECETRKYIRC